MNDQILITGASGWLGSRLEEMLPANSVRCMSGDIRSPEDCDNFCKGSRGGLLIHTASVIHPKKVSDFYEINVQGCLNLLRAASRAKIDRFIYISSNSPFGANSDPNEQFDEASPFNPYMNYGRSKMLAENHVNDFFNRGELKTVIIRAPWFYGPNQPARQTLFFSMVRDGKFPIIGSGLNRRSMVYIDNLCDGILKAAAHPKSGGQAYWIADERPYTMIEIIETIKNLYRDEFHQMVSEQQLRLPGFVGDIARFCDALLQGVGIYNQKIHVLSEMNLTIACRIEKAKRELGYIPKIELKEGMRRSIQCIL